MEAKKNEASPLIWVEITRQSIKRESVKEKARRKEGDGHKKAFVGDPG